MRHCTIWTSWTFSWFVENLRAFFAKQPNADTYPRNHRHARKGAELLRILMMVPNSPLLPFETYAANSAIIWISSQFNSLAPLTPPWLSYKLVYFLFMKYELSFITYLVNCDLFAYIFTDVCMYKWNMSWDLWNQKCFGLHYVGSLHTAKGYSFPYSCVIIFVAFQKDYAKFYRPEFTTLISI
jgi:hypothetical protein